MKLVEILERDVNGRPIRAAVRDERATVAIIAQRLPEDEWEPLYGVHPAGRISLPGCFRLNGECLRALEALDEARRVRYSGQRDSPEASGSPQRARAPRPT